MKNKIHSNNNVTSQNWTQVGTWMWWDIYDCAQLVCAFDVQLISSFDVPFSLDFHKNYLWYNWSIAICSSLVLLHFKLMQNEIYLVRHVVCLHCFTVSSFLFRMWKCWKKKILLLKFRVAIALFVWRQMFLSFCRRK